MSDTKYNILLLEDEKSIAKLMIITLNNANYNVYWAVNNKQAIEVLKDSIKIDAVVYDFKLRGEDSVEFCSVLKKDPSLKKYADIYKILYTNSKMSDFENMVNFPKIIYDEYIFKGNFGFWKEIVKKLNNRFGIKNDNPSFEKTENEYVEPDTYMFFPADSELVDINALIINEGIQSFGIDFINPVKLPDIDKYLYYYCLAYVEKFFSNSSQEKKADILGVNRNKYIRMISKYSAPDNKDIKELITNSINKKFNMRRIS